MKKKINKKKFNENKFNKKKIIKKNHQTTFLQKKNPIIIKINTIFELIDFV